MRGKRLQSVKWFPVLYVAALIFASLICFAGGYEGGEGNPTTITKSVQRPIISNKSSFSQVTANLDGKKPAGTGEFVKGYQCAAWSNGNKATDHGWIVFYCVK